MTVAGFIVALIALLVSSIGAYSSHVRGRHANALPVLVTLFQRHQGPELARARRCIFEGLPDDAGQGFDGLPKEDRQRVLELTWFYDQIGVLVTHGVIDLDPIAGYFGGSVLDTWAKLEPFIRRERELRSYSTDRGRWQEYYENLVQLLRLELSPAAARERQILWRLPVHIPGPVRRETRRRTNRA